MKMKEQNARLSLIAFMQVIFMTAGGAAIHEFFKKETNIFLILLSMLTGVVAAWAIISLFENL